MRTRCGGLVYMGSMDFIPAVAMTLLRKKGRVRGYWRALRSWLPIATAHPQITSTVTYPRSCLGLGQSR